MPPPISPEPFLPSLIRQLRAKLRFRIGPERAPRVTDDDDDGLAGALVPKRPKPVAFTGGAALPIPPESSTASAAEAISAFR